MLRKTKILSVFTGIAFSGAICTAQADLTAEQELGQALYFDQNLSVNHNQSCASCHDPGFGFVDPDNVMYGTPISDGSFTDRFGGRNSPSAAYAMFSPFFHWDSAEGLYVGGQFWDGRANTLADQAAGPFLNPVEMAMPDKWSVVDRLRTSMGADYVTMFQNVYQLDLNAIPPYNWSGAPISDGTMPPGVLEIYDRMARAIGEFEKTSMFAPFTSKFDYYLAGMVKLSKEEEKGLKIFNGKGKCNLCHTSEPTVAPDGSQTPPLFTDFTYDNLGVPANLNIPGAPLPLDLGLGGRPDIAAKDPAGNEIGKFKVMTLRNIAVTAPYAHNGVFRTLEEIVHFYNTRDALPSCDPTTGNNDLGFGTTCWPAPEVAQNVNTEELGNLRLNPKQEAELVAFLKTLTDGWGEQNGMPPLPDKGKNKNK